MLIDRPDRRACAAQRAGHRAFAALLTLLVMAVAVTPALAVGATASAGTSTAADPSASADPSAAPSITPVPTITPHPCLTPPPTPSPTPAPTPDPSASATAAPSASDAPLPSDSAAPSASASAIPSDPPAPSPSASADPNATPTPTTVICPPPTPAWSKDLIVVGDTIRFYGRGNGHGVGMSQYGARGRALAGQTMQQIVAAYFTGAVPVPIDPAKEVRVLLLSGFTARSSSPLVLHGRLGAWTIDGIDKTFPADASLRAWRASKKVSGVTKYYWRLRVVAANGKTVLANKTAGNFAIIRPAAATTRLDLDSKGSVFNRYRGRLTLLFGTSTVRVVNTVGLDDYLRGVVPVEMSPGWPLEALRAQTVVARSWTVKHLHPSTGQFDVFDDSRSQVYRGTKAERTVTNTIIATAPGLVAKVGSSIVNAFYSSAAGGWTESNENAFVSPSGIRSSTPISYLRGVDDRNYVGKAYDRAASSYNWRTPVLTHAQLNKILGADRRTACGSVLRLDLTHRGMSGRLYRVVIYGTLGRRTVSGDVFRSVYNAHRPKGTSMLLSNLFNASPLP